jgi:hypothetical protein
LVGALSISEQYTELLAARRAMAPTLSQKMFVWGLLAMKVNAWASESEAVFGIPQMVKYILVLFALFSLFYMMYQRPQTLRYYGVNGIVVGLFCIYSLWLAAGTVRSGARYFQFLLAAKYYVLPFVMPVFLLLARYDMRLISYLMKFSLKLLPLNFLCLFSVLATMNAEHWYEHLYRLHIFNFALPFVLLNIHYLLGKTRQRNLLIILYLGLMLVGAIYGRRGYVLDMIFMFAFYYLLMSFNRVVSVAKKFRSLIIVGVAVFVFIMALGFLSKKLYIFERGLDKEGWEESRGSVFRDFFSDFGKKSGDWIWGRGLDGKVLRTMDIEGGGYGDTIENGYLYIFLKAGGIYLVMMMLLLLHAAYLGWFKTSNQLTKAASATILIHIIGMISFNLPVFNAEYAMVWISVGFCYSAEIRRLTDQNVKLLLNL